MSIMIPTWVNGKLTPVEKLEAHLKGLKHKAVSVFVLAGEEVLIQKRADGKYHTPGLWANTCCTHPEWNESPADCAIRRLKEELGIERLYPAFRDTVEYRADVGGGLIEHEVVDVFVAYATKDLGLNLNPDEVAETRWVGFYDLTAEVKRRPELFTPWLRIYLEEFQDQIFGETVAAQ
ncbi:MAG: isopentenyl-diphosphate Delta-isomerase [Pseudomonadota bacterium]